MSSGPKTPEQQRRATLRGSEHAREVKAAEELLIEAAMAWHDTMVRHEDEPEIHPEEEESFAELKSACRRLLRARHGKSNRPERKVAP